MKRKRCHMKGKPKKPPVVGSNKAYLNAVTLNTEGNSHLNDFDPAEYDEMEVDKTSVGTDQPDILANINLDELVDKTVRHSFYGHAKMSLRTSNLDYRLTSYGLRTQNDTDKSSQQLALEKQVVVTENMEGGANLLPEMEVAILGNPSEKDGNIKIKSSRGLGSSSKNQTNQTCNVELVHGERLHQTEPNIPHQDPQYNMQEVNSALVVIKKVMKMEAAEPFNVSVNPIALGIPDYFDVIDTPMDFGTICRNLENGVKYMNSKDVFKDVQYIWENCYKYNNKGDYIIELMKRVKKNFTKYWAAAGLYSEQPRTANGHSCLPPLMDSTLRRSRRVLRSPVDPMNSSTRQQQQDQLGPSHPQTLQSQPAPPSCGHPYQTQLSSSLPQHSLPHAGSAGNSHLMPHADSSMRCSRCVSQCPVGPMSASTNHQQLDKSGLSQPLPQHPPPSCSQLQPSQLQTSTNTGSADSARRRIRRVPRCPVGPMTSNPSQQQQDQLGPSVPHPQQPQQPSASCSQPYQLQLSSSQPQPSQPQAGIGTGSAGHSHLPPPMDSAVRHCRCMLRCPVCPITDNPPSKLQQDHLGWSYPQPQHPQHPPVSYSQPYHPSLSSGQPQANADTGGADSAMRCNRHVPRCLVGPMISNPSQLDQLGSSQTQPWQPQPHIPSYGKRYQPQVSSSQPLSSPQQACTDNGPLHLMRHSRCVPRCPMDPLTSSPCQQQQDELDPNQPHPQQPLLSCSQPYQPQMNSNPPYQPQPSSSQLQPSQPQVGADTSRAGHSNLPPPGDSAMRCSSCGPMCQAGPATKSPSQQQQDQSGPNCLQTQQVPPSCSQPYQTQSSSSQSQPSLPESNADTDSTDFVNTRRTRGRGPTQCLSLWSRSESERITVRFDRLGEPIGPEAPKLSNFLGTIARNGHMLPLTFVDWRGVPKETKENMWQLVLSKFDIDPIGKIWVLKSLGKKWKDFKSLLKLNHYYPHKNDEERLGDRDERVLPDQWAILITFWNSKEGKKRSATNRANRGKQRFRHTSGTKSYARVREEERAKRPDGKEPTLEELFALTHTRKDGQPVDEASSIAISHLRERMTQQSKTSQGGTPQDDIFSQVRGEDRGGRVRTYGLGPSPSSIWGATLSRAEALRMAYEAKRLADEEVRQMREKMETMEQKYTSMESQMTKMMSVLQRRYPEKHTSDPLGAAQGLPQPQEHSSSSHPVPSHELPHQLQNCTMKKGNKKGKTPLRRSARVTFTPIEVSRKGR